MHIPIKSLGYRTDFIFHKFDGYVEDKGDYIVAFTQSNPNFFWGNLLLFKRAPQRGDYQKWMSLFEKEFKDPAIYHRTFAWDCPDGEEGDCSEFLAHGFELEKSTVLTATEVNLPQKFNQEIEVKEINLAEYSNKCVEIQVACADENLSKKAWQNFYSKSMSKYNHLIDKGYGKWFGAFLKGELVGSLGLFKEGDIGRFQIVSTDPDYQRQGVCSTLVYSSAKFALSKMGIKNLVMVADPDYHAAKIYESVGFTVKEIQIGLCWWHRDRG